MWPTRKPIADRLDKTLKDFSASSHRLPGVDDDIARATLAMQMVASLRRLEYTEILRNRDISPLRADPSTEMFDPERAAMFHARNGHVDEAFWLIFLATHFGKHPVHGWRRLKDVYSGLGAGIWDWEKVSADPEAFRTWLRHNQFRIGGMFGNHRKYESLKPNSPNGTAAVIESYVKWVGPKRSHAALTADLVGKAGNHPHRIFDEFYKSMNVARFGRLGKFDFLALVGRLELAPVEPGIAYLKGATGPLRGAQLLFGVRQNPDTLESWLCELDTALNIGMQAMEDSLCNWQKSPTSFVHFKG